MGEEKNLDGLLREQSRMAGSAEGQRGHLTKAAAVGGRSVGKRNEPGTPDLDTVLRAYADSDMCPMHMPGHKRKSIEEIEDMLGREQGIPLSRAQARQLPFQGSRESGINLSPLKGRRTSSGRSFCADRSEAEKKEAKRTEGVRPPEHMDITEIEGFDNLHRPEGVLRDLEAELASLYRVPAAKISVGGSTVGLLSAITAVTAPGDRVLIARNCHAAVYHAAVTQGLAVDYLLPEADGSIAPATVAEAFENNALARMLREMAEGRLPGLEAVGDPVGMRLKSQPDMRREDLGSSFSAVSPKDDPVIKATPYKVVVITCPTYEGIMSDIVSIAKIVHSYGALLIVDAAHGAHLGLSDELIFPENPVHSGADIVIVSLHKTLPALTMTGAILLAPAAFYNPQEEEKCVQGKTTGVGADVADSKATGSATGAAESKAARTAAETAQSQLFSKVSSALDIYESSSPSYVLLASIARMVRFLRDHGEEAFHQYAQKLKAFYAAADELADPAVLGTGDSPYAPGQRAVSVDGIPPAERVVSLDGTAGRSRQNSSEPVAGQDSKEDAGDGSYIRKDPSKIVILSKKDIINCLREDHHIELEMASLSYALAMTSLADSQENFDRLLASLADMNAQGQQEKDFSSFSLDLPFASASYILPEQVMSIRDAYFAPSEAAAAGAAAGRISAAFVSVFPPEIPVLVPGERIGEPELAVLASAAERGFTIHGMEDGRVRVLK